MNPYLQLFVLNPLLCIMTLWIMSKLCLHRFLSQLTDERIDRFLKKLIPVAEVSKGLIPIAEELRDSIPETVPWHIKFFGRSWYAELMELIESLTNREQLREFVEVIMEEINMPAIVRRNLLKGNPGLILSTAKTLRPWIVLAGAILGLLIGALQLIWF